MSISVRRSQLNRWLALLTAVLSVMALVVAGLSFSRVSHVAHDAASSARDLCIRAQRFGELNEAEHRKAGVYTDRDLRDFVATIPRTCPAR